MKERNRKYVRLGLTVFFTLAGFAFTMLGVYRLWETPPVQRETEAQTSPEPAALPAEETPEAEEAAAVGRSDAVYTLLLAGLDRASGCTDAILVGRLDVGRRRLDLVSIPRDTLVNLDWSVRKINAVYAGTANAGGDALEGLRRQIRCLTGFVPDCSAVIDLDVFVQAVDLVGGVDFDVPVPMHYEDPAQGLSIHLDAGPQHLNGRQAMGVARFRSGYLNGDLDRVAVQQSLLRAAAAQLVKQGSIPNLRALAALLAEHTDTDLTAANVAYLLRQALLCGEEIRMAVLPNTPAEVHGLSYVFVELEPWLELLNERLNPYDFPVTAADLDLVYLDGGVPRATGGFLRGADYYKE